MVVVEKLTSPSPKEFKINMNELLRDINEWFKTNLLSLNFKKTHYLQFRNKSGQKINVDISYDHKHVNYISSTKFQGLIFDETLP
jgi:hypothetical protein